MINLLEKIGWGPLEHWCYIILPLPMSRLCTNVSYVSNLLYLPNSIQHNFVWQTPRADALADTHESSCCQTLANEYHPYSSVRFLFTNTLFTSSASTPSTFLRISWNLSPSLSATSFTFTSISRWQWALPQSDPSSRTAAISKRQSIVLFLNATVHSAKVYITKLYSLQYIKFAIAHIRLRYHIRGFLPIAPPLVIKNSY